MEVITPFITVPVRDEKAFEKMAKLSNQLFTKAWHVLDTYGIDGTKELLLDFEKRTTRTETVAQRATPYIGVQVGEAQVLLRIADDCYVEDNIPWRNGLVVEIDRNSTTEYLGLRQVFHLRPYRLEDANDQLATPEQITQCEAMIDYIAQRLATTWPEIEPITPREY